MQPQTASRIRGDPIGIARVVVVRRPVSVDIAKIVRVASIDRAQPPIRRGFYQDVTVVGNYSDSSILKISSGKTTSLSFVLSVSFFFGLGFPSRLIYSQSSCLR